MYSLIEHFKTLKIDNIELLETDSIQANIKKISPGNMCSIIERFKTLKIDNIELLETDSVQANIKGNLIITNIIYYTSYEWCHS